MAEFQKVGVVKSTYSTVYSKLEKAIDLSGGLKVQNEEKIVVKINLCDFRTPETGAITHPLFLDAVLKYLRGNYGEIEIYVVESDATVARPDLFVKWFDFTPIIQKWKAHWCNLSHQETVEKEINGRHFRKLRIPKLFEESYFISLPKMKTCSVTKISCTLKNQFGCLPVRRKILFHPRIDDVIVDVNLAMPPNFCIVDGIIGMGGNQGPAFGVPIHSNLIVAGQNPVAVDTVCAKIMCFNPYSISHLKKAAGSKVGSMEYSVAGADVDSLKVNFKWDIFQSLLFRIANSLRVRSRGLEG
jgi:uncharacterized protein (DUF362 family)